MLRKPGIKPVAVAMAAGMLLAAAVVWWSDKAQERERVATVTALAREAGTRLHDALNMDAKPPEDQAEQIVRRFEEHFAAADGHLQKLRGLNTSSMLALGEAADDYVLTVREILRRLAASHRSQLEFAQSSQALLEHMRADRGGASWVGEAVRLKDRVEKDFSDHKAAAEALVHLLVSFPAAQAAIALHVKTLLPLFDAELLDAASQRARASVQQAAAEIEKIRKWVPRGPGRHKQQG